MNTEKLNPTQLSHLKPCLKTLHATLTDYVDTLLEQHYLFWTSEETNIVCTIAKYPFWRDCTYSLEIVDLSHNDNYFVITAPSLQELFSMTPLDLTRFTVINIDAVVHFMHTGEK